MKWSFRTCKTVFIVLRGAAQKKGGVVVRGLASQHLTCKIGSLADMLGPAYWMSVEVLTLLWTTARLLPVPLTGTWLGRP